jgi:hypothetical protein
MSATPDRNEFRQGLAGLADRMQTKIPALNGRVGKACTLILQGDVELHDDGTALVNSLTHPTVAYQVAPGLCQCKDFDRAPEHLCCHRLAAGFLRKLLEKMPAADATVVTTAAPLPEAPASVNLKALIGGYETQITLRDVNETRLLERLQTLLKRQDIRPIPKPAPRSGNWKSRQQYQGR